MSEERIVEVVNAATGLPERMVVGVSDTVVYGFAGNRAHHRRSSSACRAMGSRPRSTSA